MIQKVSLLFLIILSACNFNEVNYDIEVQGHRGCRGLMPENTIPAFLKAIDLGVRTLELDLVISEDKKVIVSHEPYFHHHISTGPDGLQITKENEKEHNLYFLSYAAIKTYDVGLKKHPGFPEQMKMATFKPLLSEVVESAEAYAKRKRKRLPNYNIEIKRVKGLDYYYTPPVEQFVDLVLEEVSTLSIGDRVTIQSFDIESLQLVNDKAPQLTTALLIQNRNSVEENIEALGYTPDVYSCNFKLVDEELIKYCRSESIKVIPWTVNEIADIQRMVFLKVDGIISDYPDRVFEVLKSF